MITLYVVVLAVAYYAIINRTYKKGAIDPYNGPNLSIELTDESKDIIDAATVPKIVWEIYSRILRDDDMAPYFNGVNTPRVVNRQIEMFRAIGSGKLAPYSKSHLNGVHSHLRIPNTHFTKLLQMILDVYIYFEVPAPAIAYVMAVLESYRQAIVLELPSAL